MFKAPERRPIDTYFNIDGEYFKLRNPERIEIKLSEKLRKLKVLKYVGDD